jgi:hypothetical protein
MPGIDMGESLVGAYLRHIRRCDVVVYNSFFADRQGEVDVVGLQQRNPRVVWLCEVTTHIDGMLLTGAGRAKEEDIIKRKLDRLRDFAEITFPDEQHRFEWWSPRVAKGRLTELMKHLEDAWDTAGRHLRFIVNEDYTQAMRELARHARVNSSTTNEPAYRLLQILSRLRGGRFEI